MVLNRAIDSHDEGRRIGLPGEIIESGRTRRVRIREGVMMRTLSAVMALAMTLAATLILGMASPLLGANALLMLGVLLFCILYQQVIIHLIKSE